MCLIAFAWLVHPDYPLILLSNRDEFFSRPTKPLYKWETSPAIFAGQDLEQGGTWMGISSEGKFGAVTNYRSPNQNHKNKRSRGFLITNYLKNNQSTNEYLQEINLNASEYNGFNLLLGNIQELYYYSNIEKKITLVEPGIYGLSNHLLDTPWPKVRFIKNHLEKSIDKINVEVEDLWKVLTNKETYPEDNLPDTGFGLEMEKKLAPVFISFPGYGTRSSNLLLINHQHQANFAERVYETGNPNKWDETKLSFKINDNN